MDSPNSHKPKQTIISKKKTPDKVFTQYSENKILFTGVAATPANLV